MKTNFVFTSGGLGNQLFQIMAALHHSEGRLLVIDSSLTSLSVEEKKSYEGRFNFGENVLINRKSKLFGRGLLGIVYSLLIRVSTYAEKSLINSGIRLIAVWSSSAFFSIYFKRPSLTVLGQGLGSTEIPESRFSKVFVGYFQTSHYFIKFHELHQEAFFRIKDPCLESALFKESNLITPALAIHLRFGDYLNEKQFGSLSRSYYEQGIKKITSSNRVEQIWIFSNDIDNARLFLKDISALDTRWYQDLGRDAVDVLSCMMQAEHFLIANSTLSWWAATLGRKNNSVVIAPNPWFKSIFMPAGLLQPGWISLESSWTEIKKSINAPTEES